MGVNSIQSTNSANPLYGEPVQVSDPKHPEGLSQIDTIESAETGSTAAAEAKWTPPSQCARCWMCVKHGIADFIDWVCSLFCSSKAATREQMKAATKEFVALFEDPKFDKLLQERYMGVKGCSENDVYSYLAENIENAEINYKLQNIQKRWDKHEKNLDKNQNLKNEVVLTERQMRSDMRRAIELMTSLGILAHSDLPNKPTSAMIEKVKAFNLGKLTTTVEGITVSLFDVLNLLPCPDELEDLAEKLTRETREPILAKFAPQIARLGDEVDKRYKEVTLQDLAKESQAVHVLADCIDVQKLYVPLSNEKGEGDVSEESLAKRVETLEKRLDPEQPVVGKETPEMRKKVKEYDFKKDEHDILYTIASTEQSAIRSRLREVISAVQEPQEAPNEQE